MDLMRLLNFDKSMTTITKIEKEVLMSFNMFQTFFNKLHTLARKLLRTCKIKTSFYGFICICPITLATLILIYIIVKNVEIFFKKSTKITENIESSRILYILK
jgi:lipopolysaccharide/colanic/teichoic acid biosynthesis glycosyltransferase